MESPKENNHHHDDTVDHNDGHLETDEIILPQEIKQKQKMTTFWVSPTTWKHVQDQRKLGETVDECLQRLIEIRSGGRRQGRLIMPAELMVTALRGHFNFPQKNITIRDVDFNPRRNTISFILEGDEFPHVPEAAEPDIVEIESLLNSL